MRSVRTCDVHAEPMADSREPVWIIGAGKTAMGNARAHHRLSRPRGQLAGRRGTFFHDREKFFPDRMHRWWTGTMVSTIAEEIAHRFDGTNEDELWSWHRVRYGLWSTPQTGNFVLGVLSREDGTIRSGLSRALDDHFVDVVNGPRTTLRSGASLPITPGSWLVNRTGCHREPEVSYEPFSSPGGWCCRSKPLRPLSDVVFRAMLNDQNHIVSAAA